MSLARTWLVARLDLAHNARRPLFWVLIALLGLMVWGLASGGARISTGDSSVGGKKAWITSELRDDTPLPMPRVASATITSWPLSAAARAMASPTMPAPTTRTCMAATLIRSTRPCHAGEMNAR